MEASDISYLAQIKILRYIIWAISILVCIAQLVHKRRIEGSSLCLIVMFIFSYMVSTVEVNLDNWWNDHVVYANHFLNINIDSLELNRDILFTIYTKFIRSFTDSYFIYFFITAILYSGCYYLSSKRLSPQGTLTMFIMFCSSLFFVAYGVNTIRAGLAMALLICGISYYNKKKIVFYTLAICAINIHFSIALTLVAFVIASFLKTPKLCFYFWILSIFASLAFGSWFEDLFANILDDSKFNNYVIEAREKETIYNTGFRWDFILYSIIPILLGFYYIYRKKYSDKFYFILYCTYIIANSFWILVIRANFSDRFAYLSWALMPILIIYPLLHQQLFHRQHLVVALCIFCNVLVSIIL